MKNKSILVKILILLIFAFITLQLYLLTSVGTQGTKVSQIRSQQAQLKIENEIKKAKISRLQSSAAIEKTVENLQMSQAEVQYIFINNDNIAASR